MPKKLEGIEILLSAFFKENMGKRYTIYGLFNEIQKKYPVKFSHIVLYRLIHIMLKNPESNLKSEKIGNYTIIWYEERPSQK
jgi:hypothetical protein